MSDDQQKKQSDQQSGKPRIETIAIHAGRDPEPGSGAIAPGIVLSTNFEQATDGSYPGAFSYGRSGNPNRERLESAMTSLEGGASAVAFSSGTAAALAVFSLLKSGDELLACRDAYHGILQTLEEVVSRWGVIVTEVDTTDVDAVRNAIGANTKMLWVETPTNPLLKLCDVAALSELAQQNELILAVDNTFATPVLQNPLSLGADFVMHSATKYLGGHSDLTGGVVVCGHDDEHAAWIRNYQIGAGAVPSAFDSWLLLRSLATLPIRVRTQSSNAARLAEYLLAHDRVSRVCYPGLASHPGHKLAAQQMREFGAMLSFCTGDGMDDAMAVLAKFKLVTRATSLGGVESLAEHRASTEGERTLAPQNLLRVSVGMENIDDLIDDFAHALS